jgi:sulfur-oxidizing protein SoxX
MNNRQKIAIAAAAIVLAGCAAAPAGPSDAEIVQELKASFAERGMAKLDRLDQTELQRACSAHAGTEMPKELREKLEKTALDAVRYPGDGKYLGDWREGERIAQSGRGQQFSDAPGTVSGGNCYACHQLDKAELAFGNIGPSLYNYGKLRGGPTEPIVKYTWGKVWNSHAFNACSQMPRYGDAGILTQQQMQHVMALLLDPNSPVNQ